MKECILPVKNTITVGFIKLKKTIYVWLSNIRPLVFLKLYFNYILHIKPNLSNQLKLHGEVNAKLSVQKCQQRILVPLIETSHYQFYHIMAIAKALEMRGAKVKVLLCGSLLRACEIRTVKTDTKDPCLKCRFNHKNAIPLFGLEVNKLSDYITAEEIEVIREIATGLVKNYPNKYEYKGVDIIPMTNDSVSRYFYGADLDLLSASMLNVIRKHLETSMICVDVARVICAEWKPDTLLGNMNVYSAWEPFDRVAAQFNSNFNLISLTAFDYNKIKFNFQEIFKNNTRYHRWLEQRQNQGLSKDEVVQLETFIQNRTDGNSKIFKDYRVFENLPANSYLLSTDRKKRNIFLFSNIHWDVGLAQLNDGAIYDGVITWVLETIEILKAHADCHLYIKLHPYEVFELNNTIKGVMQFIEESFPCLPENVTIIKPEMRIKPYDIFHLIDVGVVYNGTLGLEMLLQNIPVINVGPAPYSHLKSVAHPKSIKEYTKYLIDNSCDVPRDLEEIKLFAYFYFIKTLIPWNITPTAFSDNFKGYAFENLNSMLPGKNKYLDHICNCVLDPINTVIEGWAE